MPILKWDEQYSIGVQIIDNHHKHLFMLLNKTYDSNIKYVPTDELGALFDELINYTIYHFSKEERLMQETRFPDFQSHKIKHENFSQKVMEMNEYFHTGRNSLTLEVISFLNNWLLDHILLADVEFGRFLTIMGKNASQANGQIQT